MMTLPCLAAKPDSLVPPDSTGSASHYDPVIEALDSMVTAMFFDTSGIYPFAALREGKAPVDVRSIPDSVFDRKMAELNLETPIEMVYNKDVRRYIELYGGRRFAQMQRMLGLAYLYFPLFEATLDKYDVPLELKYLAIVESALNPTARSRAGAKGLWQFMYTTGKMYGLKTNSMVDDRFDPIRSTDAAARHLYDLYEIFDDWSLALAAYNSGAGNVTRALRRAGGVKSYWAIQPYLPRETQSYVPAFMAVVYLASYAEEYGIVPEKPAVYFQETDTITIHDVLAFDQISELHGVPVETLRLLNPAFVRDIIPAKDGKAYTIRLPRVVMPRFISLEDSVYRHVTKAGLEREKLMAEVKKAEERMTHVVRSGENLGSIARKYNVRVSELMNWNGLRSTMIYPRQRLVVFSRGETTAATKSVSTPAPVAASPTQAQDIRGQVTYTVQSGDTLWDIARRFEGITAEDIRSFNNISSAHRLKPGQVLKVPVKS